VHGQGQERTRPDGSTDPYWPLEVSGLPQENPEEAGRRVLVLLVGEDDSILHCTNKLRTAREEAWEDKDPGGIRVLLSNPRWERFSYGF